MLVFYSFISRSTGVVLTFLVGLLVANNLGQEDAGIYFTALTVSSFLSLFMKWGLDTYILKISSGSSLWFSEFFSSFLIVLSLFFFIGFFLFIYFFFKGVDYVFLIFFVSSLFVSVLHLLSAVFKSKGDSVVGNFVEAGIVSLFLCVFYVMKGPLDVFEAAMYFLCSVIVSLAFSFGFLSKRFGLGRVFFSLKKHDLVKSSKIMFSSVVDYASLWGGGVILTWFVSGEELAEYQVALRVSLLMSFFLVVLNSIISPRVAKSYRDGKKEDIFILVQLGSWLSSLSGVVFMFFVVFFGEHVLMLFGQGYISAYYVMLIILMGQFVNVFCGSVGYVLMMTGCERFYMMNTVVSFLCAVFGSFLLIPDFGLVGAAIANAGAVAIKNLMGVYWVYNIHNILMFPTFNGLKLIFKRGGVSEILDFRH